MGVMSDLHLLATEVLETDVTIEQQVESSSYDESEIRWAVEELKRAKR